MKIRSKLPCITPARREMAECKRQVVDDASTRLVISQQIQSGYGADGQRVRPGTGRPEVRVLLSRPNQSGLTTQISGEWRGMAELTASDSRVIGGIAVRLGNPVVSEIPGLAAVDIRRTV